MDATCAIQASIHVFSLVRKYVSRILGTYHLDQDGSGVLFLISLIITIIIQDHFLQFCSSNAEGLILSFYHTDISLGDRRFHI